MLIPRPSVRIRDAIVWLEHGMLRLVRVVFLFFGGLLAVAVAVAVAVVVVLVLVLMLLS